MDKATLFRDHDYGALALALSEGHVLVWDHNLVQEDAHAIRQVLGRYARVVEGTNGTERWRVRNDVYMPKMMHAVIQEMRGRGYGTDPLGERAILSEVDLAEAQAPDLPNARSPLVHDAVERGVRQHIGLAVAAIREHSVCSTPSIKFHERPNATRVGVQRPPFVVARMFTGSMAEGQVREIVLEALKPINKSIVKLSVMESEEGNAVEIGLAIEPSIMESYLDKRLPVFEHKVTGARDVLFLLESPLDAQALEDLTKMARLTTAATSVMSEQNALVIRVPSGYSGDHLADHALRERIEWLANTLEPWGVTIHEVGELTEVQAPAPEPERKPLAELGECVHHDHPPMKTVAMMMEEEDCEEHLERAGMTEREAGLAARAWHYEVKRGGTPSSWMRRIQECTGRSHDDLNNIITEAVDPSHNWSMANNGLVSLKKKLTDAGMQAEAGNIRKLLRDSRGEDVSKLRQARRRVGDLAAKILRTGNTKLSEFAANIDMQLMLYMIRKGLEEGVLDEATTEADMVKLFDALKPKETVLVAMRSVMGSHRKMDNRYHEWKVGRRSHSKKYGVTTLTLLPMTGPAPKGARMNRVALMKEKGIVNAAWGDMGVMLKGFKRPVTNEARRLCMNEARTKTVTIDGVKLDTVWSGPKNGYTVVVASDWDRLDDLVDKGKLRVWHGGPSTMGHVSYLLNEARRPSARKIEHDKLMAKALMRQGVRTMRPINRSEYPTKPGLEGPFQFKHGHILYYDPKEGSYYDSKSDRYVSLSDIGESVDEARGRELQPGVPATVQAGPDEFVIMMRTAASMASPRKYWTGSGFTGDRKQAKKYTARKEGSSDLRAAKKAAKDVSEATKYGLHPNSDGSGYTTLTRAESKTFTSKTAAVKWLRRRGYKPDGTKLHNEGVNEVETLGQTFVCPSDRTDAIYTRPGELSGEDGEEAKDRDRYIDDDTLDLAQEESLDEMVAFRDGDHVEGMRYGEPFSGVIRSHRYAGQYRMYYLKPDDGGKNFALRLRPMGVGKAGDPQDPTGSWMKLAECLDEATKRVSLETGMKMVEEWLKQAMLLARRGDGGPHQGTTENAVGKAIQHIRKSKLKGNLHLKDWPVSLRIPKQGDMVDHVRAVAEALRVIGNGTMEDAKLNRRNLSGLAGVLAGQKHRVKRYNEAADAVSALVTKAAKQQRQWASDAPARAKRKASTSKEMAKLFPKVFGKKESVNEDADVANMILKQIRRGMGGLNYGAMGIKRGSIYSSSGGSGIMGAMDVKGPGVQFDVRGHWKGRVIVRLDQGRDTYTVIFGRVRGANWKIDKRLDDIYASALGKTIERNVLGTGIRESVDEAALSTALARWTLKKAYDTLSPTLGSEARAKLGSYRRDAGRERMDMFWHMMPEPIQRDIMRAYDGLVDEGLDEGWLNERTEALPDNADEFLRKMIPKKLKGVGIPGMDWIGQPKLANNRMSYGGAMFSRDSKVAPGAYYFFIDKPNRITRDWSAELVIKSSMSRTKIVKGYGDTVAKALNNLRVQIDPTKVIVVHGLQAGDRVSGKYYGTTFKGALVRNSRGHSGLYLDFDAESSPFPFKHKGREYEGVMLTPFSFGGKMAFNRASHSYIDTVNGKVMESAPLKWAKVSV